MRVGVNVGGGLTNYDGRHFADLVRQSGVPLGEVGWPRRPSPAALAASATTSPMTGSKPRIADF